MSEPNAFAQAAQRAAEAARSATSESAQSNGGGLVDEDDTGNSGLFGGEKLPGLFNRFVMPGVWREGIIMKPPTQRQGRDVDGKPKFWDPETEKVVTSKTHPDVRPLYDSVIVLKTEYRFTEQEIADRDIDPVDVEEDEGVRGIFASGDLKKAIMRAIKKARVHSEKEMVGMKLRVNRGKKVPIPGTQKTRWEGAEAELIRP
jgi:hypothetical protein